MSGLGLIGLLTAQPLLLKDAEFRSDPDSSKCDLSKSFGIPALCLSDGVDPVAWCLERQMELGWMVC